MDLYEIEGKKLLHEFGIPADEGFLYTSKDDERIQFPCVLKAQVLSGKRGKAGGVKVVHDVDELEKAAETISGLVIGGKKVQAIMVSPFMDIAKEHYLGITLDALNRKRVLLYSSYGGMDIEQLAEEDASKLVRMDVTEGLEPEELMKLVIGGGASENAAAQIVDIASKLYRLFIDCDATTAEINPLVESSDGKLTAADSKVVIDSSALYRQKDMTIIPRPALSELEQMAEEQKIGYVEIDETGNVGLVVIGAGLGMATLDTAIFYGLKPYDFTDLGSKLSEHCFRIGVRLVMQNPGIKAILFNGFGGMFSTKEMAQWILASMDELGGKKIPVVVKLRGYAPEEGWSLLEEAGILLIKNGTTDDAVKLLKQKLEEAI